MLLGDNGPVRSDKNVATTLQQQQSLSDLLLLESNHFPIFLAYYRNIDITLSVPILNVNKSSLKCFQLLEETTVEVTTDDMVSSI